MILTRRKSEFHNSNKIEVNTIKFNPPANSVSNLDLINC